MLIRLFSCNLAGAHPTSLDFVTGTPPECAWSAVTDLAAQGAGQAAAYLAPLSQVSYSADQPNRTLVQTHESASGKAWPLEWTPITGVFIATARCTGK